MNRKIIVLSILILVLVGWVACTAQPTPLPDDKTWLRPGKINISNYYSGETVKQKIGIHNGKNQTCKFRVYFRTPDYVENTFFIAPVDAKNWIDIKDDFPIFEPNETKEVEIDLNLPDKVETPDRWEFWIGVKENNDNNGNLVITELCSRWLITMRRN